MLATALLVQGSYCLHESGSSPALMLSGVAALILSGLLVVGFLTPFACILIGLYATGIKLSWIPTSTHNVIDSSVSAIFAATILLGATILGPGALSIDARMFGRREIIIPPRVSRPE